jgi:hypothetical protein
MAARWHRFGAPARREFTMQGSAFPTTHATWLRTLVGDGVATAARGNAAETARIAVMERYAEPLSVFVRGSSLARLGEPNEIVNGFFAARLSDAGSPHGRADDEVGPRGVASDAGCSASAFPKLAFGSP